jgi:predicted CXXCH cytochrome family protein
MHKHGPVAQGDCAKCHTVHGGDLSHLLTKALSDEFYQAFSPAAYELCLSCHDPRVFAAPAANPKPAGAAMAPGAGSAAAGTARAGVGGVPEMQTGFRDGTRNLHALHVNKTPQGRSCRSCHTTHASRFQAQIADSVQYGQWNLPINFTPTPTGGSCAPGCHKPERYDRGSTAPMDPSLKGPGAAPAGTPAPAPPK